MVYDAKENNTQISNIHLSVPQGMYTSNPHKLST